MNNEHNDNFSYIPNEIIEIILKSLPEKVIEKVKCLSKNFYRKVQTSHYKILKRKVEDRTIYEDLVLFKNAKFYIAFEYLSLKFELGTEESEPKVDDGRHKSLLKGEGYSVFCFTDRHQIISEQLDIDLITDIDFDVCGITWLSIETKLLLYITELYFFIN